MNYTTRALRADLESLGSN